MSIFIFNPFQAYSYFIQLPRMSNSRKVLSVFSTSPGNMICSPHLHLLKTVKSVKWNAKCFMFHEKKINTKRANIAPPLIFLGGSRGRVHSVLVPQELILLHPGLPRVHRQEEQIRCLPGRQWWPSGVQGRLHMEACWGLIVCHQRLPTIVTLCLC